MIERITALEQAELHRSGMLGVKIAVLLVEDGVEIDCRWHRTAIDPEGDVQAQMEAVNAHLASMEPAVPAVSQADIDHLKDCHDLIKARLRA